jgi:hypothetical protein
MCYVGSREKGQEYLAAILSWDGERCLLNEVDEKSFLHQQDSVAQVLRGKGTLSFCGLRISADIRPFSFLFSPLFSGSSMVHPFRFDNFFAGRYYQRNSHEIRRHSCRLQYVFLPFVFKFSF